jgi:hypothetical protein
MDQVHVIQPKVQAPPREALDVVLHLPLRQTARLS